jgi:6-phosphofructokinase 1
VSKVCEKILKRDSAGRLFSIVVVAEGSFPKGGSHSVLGASLPGQAERVGGIAETLAREIQAQTQKECRSLILGHLQRGGMPTGYDRLLAARFGGAAVRAVADERWGDMVALQSSHINTIPIREALGRPKRVDVDGDVVLTARATGISFGD